MRKLISTVALGGLLTFAGLSSAGTAKTATPKIGWGLSQLVDHNQPMAVANQAAYGWVGAEIGLLVGGPVGGLVGAVGGAL